MTMFNPRPPNKETIMEKPYLILYKAEGALHSYLNGVWRAAFAWQAIITDL